MLWMLLKRWFLSVGEIGHRKRKCSVDFVSHGTHGIPRIMPEIEFI